MFGGVGPLGENLDFFSSLGFDVQTDSHHETQEIKLCPVRALKRYLNEKNLIHGRVISKRFQNLVHRFLKRILELSGNFEKPNKVRIARKFRQRSGNFRF